MSLWMYQIISSGLCYPFHTHLFISEMLRAEVEVLGPKSSSFSLALRAKTLQLGPGVTSSGKSGDATGLHLYGCEAGDQHCLDGLLSRQTLSQVKSFHGKTSHISVAASAPFRTPGEAFTEASGLTQLMAHPELPMHVMSRLSSLV